VLFASRPIPLGALALMLSACLDFGYKSVRDGGVDAGEDGSVPHDADTQACPETEAACVGHCGRLKLAGCAAYACEPCAPDCKPVVSCESIAAQCGELDTGCGMVDCPNRCAEGVSCVDNQCCKPEADATACRGLCGGTVVNSCGVEVACTDPCGPHSSGCRAAQTPLPATCFCPHASQGETCEEKQLPLVRPTDLAIDVASGRAYVLDEGLHALLTIDLETGARSTLSDGDDDGVARGTGPAFANPRRIALDLAHRRAFVTDMGLDAIVQVDLDHGQRAILSGSDHGTGLALKKPKGIVLDVTKDTAYVVDANDALLAVGLTTGDRRVISSAAAGSSVGAGPPLALAMDLAIDLSSKRAYVFGGTALLSVDLTSGDRTLISTDSKFATPEGSLRGTGPAISGTVAGALDLAHNRAYVGDADLDAVIAVDLATGDRSFLSTEADPEGAGHGTGPDLELPLGLRLDAGGATLWLVEEERAAILQVELATGNRTPRADGGVGTGPRLQDPSGVAYDQQRSRLLVVDESAQAVVAADLASGARSMLSSELALHGAYDAVIDRAGHYAYVSGNHIGIVRIDLATGQHSLLSNDDDSSLGPQIGLVLARLELDEPRQQLLVTGSKLLAVDLATGRRSIVSDGTHGSGPLFAGVSALAFDQARHAMLCLDRSSLALYRVDLVTGTRTVVSGPDPDGVVHGEGPAFARPSDVAFDANAQVAYVVDNKTRSVIAVNVTTGDRSAISTVEGGLRRGNGVGLLSPEGLTLDGHGQLLVTDSLLDAVISVNPATGDRSIVSRLAF
jgi:DNA-binding beta-propeller fold protein YncE